MESITNDRTAVLRLSEDSYVNFWRNIVCLALIDCRDCHHKRKYKRELASEAIEFLFGDSIMLDLICSITGYKKERIQRLALALSNILNQSVNFKNISPRMVHEFIGQSTTLYDKLLNGEEQLDKYIKERKVMIGKVYAIRNKERLSSLYFSRKKKTNRSVQNDKVL